MSTSQVYDKLPCTISEWKARAKRLKVTTKSPNDLQAVNSGSKVTFREFLTMRIIRPELQSLRDFPHEETSEAVANDIIQADATFMAWLSGVENKDRPDKGLLGIFALVKQGMLMVTARDSVEPPFESARLRPRSSAPVEQPHLPAESSSMDVERATSTSESVVTRVTPAEENLWAPFPRTAAEEEINYFLLNLLNAYTLSLNARVRCEWIAHRNPFLTVSFGQVELSAYVDGYLRHIGGQEAFAILEVKAAKRNHKNAFQVMWQESAEMVAWILRDESKDREYPFSERLLISQNRHEIYLTLATYKKPYLQFLKGEFGRRRNYNEDRFLTMQEYGPWLIDKKSHMLGLAKIIMGFCHRVSSLAPPD